MRFVVISRPTPTDDRDRHRDEEERLLAKMRADGFIEQIYRRADGQGAYSIVEAESEEEARRRLAALPFVAHRCIDIEVIRVEPRFEMSPLCDGDISSLDTGSPHLRAQLCGTVLKLELANEARRNALSMSMLQGLERSCADLAKRSDVRVVVITGAGDAAFAAGADLSEIGDDPARASDSVVTYEEQYRRTIVALRDLSTPLIARIRGVCVGGGVTVALTADVRVADESATFAIPAARIGLAYRHVESLIGAVGAENASDLLLTARSIGAREAVGMRLISRVTEPQQLDATVAELASMMSRNAPLSLAAGKLAIRSVLAGRPSVLEAHVDELVERCRSSLDHQEGLSAVRATSAPFPGALNPLDNTRY